MDRVEVGARKTSQWPGPGPDTGNNTMADLRGRCRNTELCDLAVSNRIVEVHEGDPFVCRQCGNALEPVGVSRSKAPRAFWIGAQLVAVVLGIGAVAWKLTSKPAGTAPAVAASAATTPAAAAPAAAAPLKPAAPHVTTLVTGGSFMAPPPAAAAPSSAPSSATSSAASSAAPPPASAEPAKVLLRLAGADALANNVVQRLAAGYLSLIGDTAISTAPGDPPDTLDVTGQQGARREAIRIAPQSSDDGFTALLRGTADMAMTTRKITNAESERLASIGDLTSSANEHVIGAQGITVIVSPANQVPSLTVAQLRGITSGKIKDWSELRGSPGAIRLITFDSRAGGGEAPEDLLLGDDGLSSSATRIAPESALAAAVATDRLAIGFVTRGNAGTARVLPVADGGAVAVLPTDLAIATETYPLTRRLYIYTANDAAGGVARRFSDYIASPAGQAVVEASGLIPLNVRSDTFVLPDTASDRLRQLVTGTTRISVTFHFKPNSTELDSRGVRDMDRLMTYLKSQRISSSRIVLAAFADNSGPAAVNQAVSQRRADAVVGTLTRAGIAPGKVGAFGADLAVADNATADGRERNRRVEVYLATP